MLRINCVDSVSEPEGVIITSNNDSSIPRSIMFPFIGALARFLTVTVVEEPPDEAISRVSSANEISAIASLFQFGSTV